MRPQRVDGKYSEHLFRRVLSYIVESGIRQRYRRKWDLLEGSLSLAASAITVSVTYRKVRAECISKSTSRFINA